MHTGAVYNLLPQGRVRIFHPVLLLPIMLRKTLFALLLPACLLQAVPRSYNPASATKMAAPADTTAARHWVDSVFQALSPAERLGQLFMLPVHANDKFPEEQAQVTSLIKQYSLGGIIFMQGSPTQQVKLSNYYQAIARVPLLMAQDAEWGPAMRLDSSISFPRQIALGAINNDTLIYRFGLEVGRECKRVGINLDFAPDIDINNNAMNPVIGDRSFGENKYRVAHQALLYMQGLQDAGVLACAKHFPGHGDTDKDSHKTLPLVSASRSRLDSLEFYPFRALIKGGVKCAMVAHLYVPSLDTTAHQPSSLSRKIVSGLLRDTLGFQGLIFTDALNMKGVAGEQPGMAELKALMAGNDMLLYPTDVPKALAAIQQALSNGSLSQTEVDAHVKRVLQAKFWCGLSHPQNTWKSPRHLFEDMNTPAAQLLKQQLVENELTLLQNKNALIPFRGALDTFSFASVALGGNDNNAFQAMLDNYAPVDFYHFKKDETHNTLIQLAAQLKNYKVVFVSIHGTNRKPEDHYGTTENEAFFIDELKRYTRVVLVLFGNPYALDYFRGNDYVLDAYSDDPVNQQEAAQLLFGGIPAKGHLAVSAGDYHAGDGLESLAIRLKYTLPEEVKMSGAVLDSIALIVNNAMTQQAMPGCQVWVAKDGKVIYNRSFGYYTYDHKDTVRNNSLYDLASVTKIGATTLSVMRLYQEGKINPDSSISYYLPEFKGTNKASLKVHEVMTHQAGLKPYLLFYKNTMDSGKLSPKYYGTICSDQYCVPVTGDLFIQAGYPDQIWQQIVRSPVNQRGEYVYSDLDFYIMQKIVEKQSGLPLNVYAREQFYAPLGLNTTTFLPAFKFPLNRIVPSNKDPYFRHETIQGYVHDPGAAMYGGVAGHAGLFSNANNLGTLMEVLMQNGQYGGLSYFDSATVAKFTGQYDKSCRRGLGFDRAECAPGKPSPCIAAVSCNTYGHQGFTGTVVWCDPKSHLVYVFLSNRTYPDEANKKLVSLGIREKVMQVLYDAMK